jgi:2-amino-4-hydroxy-6-hydroxymethyldihydropteridine diphosphokinase
VKKQDISENQAKNIFLGIGSNLGNRIINIEKAKSLLLENDINFISVSNYYETPSWPDPKKPKFINIVLKVTCKHKPQEMINLCKLIEAKLGRRKSPKNSPRICDIDIIDFEGISFERCNYVLPHARMHERNFVLFPLFEIEKEWVHPIKKVNIKKLIFSLPNKDIRSIKQI